MSERYNEQSDQSRNREEEQYTDSDQYGNQNPPSSKGQRFNQTGTGDPSDQYSDPNMQNQYGSGSTDPNVQNQYGDTGMNLPDDPTMGGQYGGQGMNPGSDPTMSGPYSGQGMNPGSDPTKPRSQWADRQRQDDDPNSSGQYGNQDQANNQGF